MRQHKGKGRRARIAEAKGLNRAAHIILKRSGTKVQPGQRPVDVLATLAELPILERTSFFNKRWRMLKAVAILAPKFEVELPPVRASLRNSFLVTQDKNDPGYAVIATFPYLRATLGRKYQK